MTRVAREGDVSYCAICGNRHDPNVACVGQGSQVLLEAGLKHDSKISETGLQKGQRALRLAVLGIVLVVVANIVAMLLILR
jgi:hypothetical protein